MGNTTTKSHYSKSIPVGTNPRRSRWDGPGLPSPPGKPILIPGTNDAQPDVVAIRWERSPSNGGSAILGYLVEHRRLGSPYWVRSTPVLCAFPELTFSGLEPGWRYQFRVRAQNALGLSEPSEISDPLTVTLQRATASVPHFDLELKDTVALENEQVEFTVHFSGTPLPKISWFKDGFEIFSSRRTKIFTENGRSVLLIHQTALNDEGEIKCTATNRAGHISTKAKLILEAPPKIRLPRQYEDGLLFEQDETIRLKVSLAGKPPPVVTWYHDGEMILKDDRHVFEEMEGESILKIPDAKRNDRGEYVVKAINKLGEDTSSFLVTVTDRPAAPGKATVTMILSRSVILSWKEPEDDGGCKIGTYIVEYYRIGWDVWLKATTSRQTTAALSELIENSEYKFRVKAENPYGVSDPSEESDIVFIPDLKRGITAPTLSGKSQSHREISRSRGEKREVSFSIPAQRTRSLTREEGIRNEEDNIYLGPGDRSASTQRLTRPSRADSRVTFALDTITHEDKPETSTLKDHSFMTQDRQLEDHLDTRFPNNEETNQKKERPMSPKPTATVVISPPIMDESSKRLMFKESKSRSLSVSREKSPSPISDNRMSSHHLHPTMTLSFKKDSATMNDSTVSLPTNTAGNDTPNSPLSPREGDENELHGSSEFMLVLYPEDHNKNPGQNIDISKKNLIGASRCTGELEEEEDLLPPPMSYSLPELFSEEHQVVETLREAVSSTELLHERAMERFYKAIAAEEASEMSKRKTQLERKTGELATLKSENGKMGNPVDTEYEDMQNRRSSFLRRLSNSGMTTQNIINSWQTKKNRRRSSEGQAEISEKPPKNLLPPISLSNIEARSDPSLLGEGVSPMEPWRRENEDGPVERLRRWHETNLPLIGHEEQKESALILNPNNEEVLRRESIIRNPQISKEHRGNVEEEEEEEEEESIETSEESSEEISSADSEDLKLLRSRILARQSINEEDTYHPKGRVISHIEGESGSMHETSNFEISPDVAGKLISPVSSTNVIPKSILKKPKETSDSLNNCDKPLPPKKPIRKTLPQSLQQPLHQSLNQSREDDLIIARRESLPNTSEVMKAGVMSESDTDSILSAAEAAKNRRIHGKTRSMTPSEEENEEADMEARMAVVNHYTEIVREYSSHSKNQEERKFTENSPRRPSISNDHNQKYETEKTHEEKNNIAKVVNRRNSQHYDQETKIKNKSEENRQESTHAPTSRKSSISSAPSKMKEKRVSRPTSRNQSPEKSRMRNTSTERNVSSRSSSKTRARTSSRDRNRSPSRAGSEDRYAKEKSVERMRRPTVSSRSSSRASSRSNSRDRHRATTPVDVKVEKLHKALEKKKYRSLVKNSEMERDYPGEVPGNDGRLIVNAEKTVRSMVSYVTDLTLLMAAVYVYLFKKETLAVPFIALLLYRRVQQEVFGRIFARNWRWQARK